MHIKKLTIAIDGPAGAGKGTLARHLAQHYNLAYLDTGLLYRALALKVLKNHTPPDNVNEIESIAHTITLKNLEDTQLRHDDVAEIASKVSAHLPVRKALLALQRNFARNPPQGFNGVVLDGRDIGTVVCPEADVKIYVTAQVEIRAKRRLKELQERGIKSIYSAVLQDMMNRDMRDSKRVEAPLKPALDAYVIDTTSLDPIEVFKTATAFIDQRLSA